MKDKVTKNAVRRELYKNILVYTIVATFVTVTLLFIMLSSPLGRKFTTLIITTEIVMFIVLIYSMVAAYVFLNSVLSKMENKNKYTMKVDRCPDFYSSHRDGNGNVVCKNGVQYPDSGHVFRYVSHNGRDVPNEVPLKTVDGKTYKVACSIANPSDSSSPNYNIPWTALRPKCDTTGAEAVDPEVDAASCKSDFGYVFSE